MVDVPLNILIADDNKSDRLILAAIVKKMGHKVCVAEDGVQAVAQYHSEKPDIILLDVMMPNMNGQEAAVEIKSSAGEDMVPIIFLTSLQDATDLAKCLDSGGDDFLTKPYNKIILQAKINAFSRMSKMHYILQQQRNLISDHNEHMVHEQEVAKAVYDNVTHAGCLNLPNIKHMLSPFSVFNGDVLLAARKPSGSMHILLGDFTGHGLPAAIGAMPLAEIFYGMTAKGFLMDDILREINSKLKKILPIGYFCCVCMVNLSFRKQQIEVWMGGLPDFYLLRHDTGQVEKLASTHLPLGVLSSQGFDSKTQRYSLRRNDRLFMWSDGIIESRNDQGDLFGETRLMDIFNGNQDQEQLFDNIVNTVNEFTGESGKDDDTTLLEVKMVPEAEVGEVDIDMSRGMITGPTDWNMRYTLRGDTLKTFNPLPVMLGILSDVPALHGLSGQLYTLMAELFSNAFEHGVLGLSSDLKKDAKGFAEYYAQRELAMKSMDDGQVMFEFDHSPTQAGGLLTLTVTDSGGGFDYVGKQANQFSDAGYSGRGIPLIVSICDSLEYLGRGNIVKVTLSWNAKGLEE
ncbi:fused response regulator/phosphatase [Bermanella sp. 47_1433_sub80_T6]|nr:fused response regulator/phosphatase [Bermanella sp. 47_1433_sub80_T6]